jgi:anti-sigma factor RsiW
MPDDLLNILSNSNKDIDNQKLMDYISGKLSGQEKHEVEKWMADNDFINEAVEGLQQVKQDKDIVGYTDQLNKQLNQYLLQKKRRRLKKKIAFTSWTYLAILLILALAIIVFLIVHSLQRH